MNAWVITKVNDGVSPKSTFRKLLKKLLMIKELRIRDIIKIYDGYLRV